VATTAPNSQHKGNNFGREKRFEGLPAGGRVRIKAKSDETLKAVHDFLRFQIEDHHTGDSTEVS
jgi:hypothetical protein